MKILIVHNFYQQPGGEDVVFAQERALLERKGHTVLTYTRSNHELNDATAANQLKLVKNMLWADDSRRDIQKLLREERPDIVHTHNTFFTISASIFGACKDAGVPVVQTLHNFRILCPVSTLCRNGAVCRECIDESLLRGVRYGCYHQSKSKTAAVALMLAAHRARGTWVKEVSAYIALTNFAKRLFVENGLPEEKIYVKPNFVEPDPKRSTVPAQYAIFVGRLSPEKGVSTMLKAWKLLPTPIPLKIVGDGPERAALEAEVRRLGLQQVDFLGRLDRAEALQYLNGARFALVPSLWYEGFAVVLVESFACSVPVLGSRLGAMQELIRDGVTGLHFNPGDTHDLAQRAQWAWDHPQEMADMGANARQEYLTKYTADKNYDILMGIYQKALIHPYSYREPARSPTEEALNRSMP